MVALVERALTLFPGFQRGSAQENAIDVSPSPGILHELGGTGVPVVLVGEVLGGHLVWSRHAERLAQRWRVIGITPLITALAAQGRPRPDDWEIPMETRALAEALDGAGVGMAHLVGWSLGGSIALGLAMAHPERVATLTLIEPQARWLLRRLGWETEQQQAESARMRVYETAEITEELLADFLRMAGVIAPGEDPREGRAWPLAWANRLALGGVWRVTSYDDDPARLQRLTMPVLLVRGRDSTPIDRGVVGVLAEQLPHAVSLELPGNHSSHMTSREAFLDALEALMGGVK